MTGKEEKDKKAKMSRKKGEAALQQDIESQDEWDDMLASDGFWVVDIYQEWCGPCKAMISNLRRLKNELSDDMLKFATAKADTIDSLEKYRGKCEPTFMFYAGGVLVAIVRGSDSPKIQRTIMQQLSHEHKVADGKAERKEIKDPLISELANKEKSELDEEESEKTEPDAQTMEFEGELVNFGDSLAYSSHEGEVRKEVTVAIIKPDAVEDKKADDIIEQMKEAGIEILKQEEKRLSEEEARDFYSHLCEEPFYEDLVKFMSSGPSIVLVITKGKTGENIIEEWRDFIGPTTVEDAREMAPNSLRAKYGSEKFRNAVHGSDSSDTAARELAFFFPDFAVPTVSTKVKLQRTLALIRPDAFKTHKDEILEKIRESGFKIAMSKEVNLTNDQIEEFYKEHKNQLYFDDLANRMTSGPLLALALAREDAIDGWRSMLGPKELSEAKEQDPDSLRAKYTVEGVNINQLHGSDSEGAAEKEIDFFFPMQQTVAAIPADALGTKDEIIEKIHEAGFRIAARKETTLPREVAEEFYAEVKDEECFEDLVEQMVSGPTFFMVLSREDAVEGWRQIIGPANPDKAKEEQPDSIRALYGNAVSGCSNPEQVKKSMDQIFGKLDFNKDGTVQDSLTALNENDHDLRNSSTIPEQEKEEEVIQQEERKELSEASPEAKQKEDEQKESSRPSSPKSQSPKPGSRPASAKENEQTESQKPESPKQDTKPDSPKPDSRPGSAKIDSKPDSRPGSVKADTKPDSPKPDSPRPDSGKKESSSPRPDSPKKEDSTVEKKDSSEDKSESSDKKDDGDNSESKDDSTQGTEESQKTDDSKKEDTEDKSEESDPKSSDTDPKSSDTEPKSSDTDPKSTESESKTENTQSKDEEKKD